MQIEPATVVHYEGSQFAVTRDDGSTFQFRLSRDRSLAGQPLTVGPWFLEVSITVGTGTFWYPCAPFDTQPPLAMISMEQRDAQSLIDRRHTLALTKPIVDAIINLNRTHEASPKSPGPVLR
jgi:hypothetical protein